MEQCNPPVCGAVIPLGAPLPRLRFQALYLEPAAPTLPPLMATNGIQVLP